MKIKAVAFDIDGTLYPNAAMYLRSAWFGFKHLALIRAIKAVRDEMRHNPEALDDFYAVQAQKVAERLGIEATIAREKLDRIVYGEWEQLLHGISLYPGVPQFLNWCRSQGFKMGIASDFPVERKLQVLQLEDRWDCKVSTEATGCLKPNELPFRILSECLGVEPNSILYVGNSYDYDICGAKAVGMLAAHISNHPVINGIADFTFSSYGQLQKWIIQRNIIDGPN